MGFNPFRPRKGSKKVDYVVVIAAVIVVVALLAWAVLG